MQEILENTGFLGTSHVGSMSNNRLALDYFSAFFIGGNIMNKQDFITKIASLVQKHAPVYGIKCPSAVIAQAILESGYGESILAAKYHNYFDSCWQ